MYYDSSDKLNEINNFDLHQYEIITDIEHHYNEAKVFS